ncbi:MAG: hypothetical protein ACRD4U_04045 [Candidatus Acidiferrales bacterium]
MKRKTTAASREWWTFVSAALFALVYVAARLLLKQAELESPLRLTVALLPVPFFAVFLWGEIRMVRRLDELERKIQLEALAVAFPLAILLLMMLGLLELAVPLPPEDWSYRHVWAVVCFLYFVGLAIARRRYQ